MKKLIIYNMKQKINLTESEFRNLISEQIQEALQDEDVRKAFEKALQDICDGLLPLGGGTNRGNGIFIGTLNIQE